FIFDSLDANKQAFIECIKVIEANIEDIIINKANEKEKKWWIDGNYKFIDENRLPLILMENVTYDEFEKKCEKATASKFWEYRDKNVIIIELPKGDYEVAHREFIRQFIRQDPQDIVRDIGSKRFKGSKGSSKQADVSLVPKYLPNLPKYLSDSEGNTWPTIICETASTQSLKSIIQKTTKFWLAPNRVEDIIIFKLWPSKLGRNQNRNLLRRLTCYKFCRRTSPKDVCGNYQPIQVIEFGTINSDGNPYYGCSTLGSCTLSISPHCIYKGCTYPYPLTDDVVIDLFSIQQEIFAVMKKDVIRKDIIRKVVIRKDVIRKDVMKKNVMKKGVMKKRFIKKK
ncbi:22324_t:CDS:2, partial [Rhizophagus irregularis]